MNGWWSPRWWPWHLLVLTVILVFVWLGTWQLDRHRQLQRRNAVLESRLDEAPRSYEDWRGLLDPDAALGSERDARHRPATARGRFDPEHEVLLRGRSHQGRAGHHVLTPLRLEGEPGGERALLVNRGWVPYELDEPPVEEAAPPAGVVEVRGRLLPEQDPPTGFMAAFAPRDPPDADRRLVAYADVERLQQGMPYRLEPFLLVVRASSPAAEAELPIRVPAPEPEAGPHLGYAGQWFAFAVIAVVGYVLLLRRRLRA